MEYKTINVWPTVHAQLLNMTKRCQVFASKENSKFWEVPRHEVDTHPCMSRGHVSIAWVIDKLLRGILPSTLERAEHKREHCRVAKKLLPSPKRRASKKTRRRPRGKA